MQLPRPAGLINMPLSVSNRRQRKQFEDFHRFKQLVLLKINPGRLDSATRKQHSITNVFLSLSFATQSGEGWGVGGGEQFTFNLLLAPPCGELSQSHAPRQFPPTISGVKLLEGFPTLLIDGCGGVG